MSEPIEIRLPNNQVVWAQLSGPARIRDTARGGPGVFPVEDFHETIAAVAESIRDGLARLRPTEISTEFGIQFQAKTGKVVSVLAEAGAAATIKVKLTWQSTGQKDAEDEDEDG